MLNRHTVLERDHCEMLKLLATAAVLLALAPQWVDSTTTAISHSKGHLLKKVGCRAHWWGFNHSSKYLISLPEKSMWKSLEKYSFFSILQRGILSNRPSTPCTTAKEGLTVPVDSDTVWLCKRGRWLPYR